MEYAPVRDYELVSLRSWKTMNLNLDDHDRWLRDDAELCARLFYLEFARVDCVLFLKDHGSDHLGQRAACLGIIGGRTDYLSSSGRVTPLDVYWLRSRDSFVDLFWPDNVMELRNAAVIGLCGKVDEMGAPGTVQLDILSDAITARNIGSVLPSLPAGNVEWLYTIRRTDYSYDAADPEYWLNETSRTGFRDWISQTAAHAGYELHSLPMLDPLVWNWIGYGEISVLQSEDGLAD